ncbi:MAG: hypothetical protein RI894_2516 [Bacteroidota bacterium]|jgi:hypothetical protein
MALKPFEKWKYEEVNKTFGYARIYSDFAPLVYWLSKKIALNENDILVAEILRGRLVIAVNGYNEDELKMQFIAPILSIVNFSRFDEYRLFSQRKISAVAPLKDGTTDILTGRVEAMVALGVQNPQHPYFFIHEYKPLNKSTPSDPLGQLVAAMIVAQITNNDEKPIYGLYVRGEFWVFVVLNGKEYAESKPYNATQADDLKLILQALFWVKQYIEHRIDTENI